MATHPLVLLIEPDPMLRQLIHGELKDQGCIVFDTATGAEALAFAELYPGAINLAVTDLETSDSGEVDFVDALRSLPTGGQAKVSSLMKPFDRGDVVAAVREALPPSTLQARAEYGDAAVFWGSRDDRQSGLPLQ